MRLAQAQVPGTPSECSVTSGTSSLRQLNATVDTVNWGARCKRPCSAGQQPTDTCSGQARTGKALSRPSW